MHLIASQSNIAQAQAETGKTLNELIETCSNLGINVRRDICDLRYDINQSLAGVMVGHNDPSDDTTATGFPKELPIWLSRLYKESSALQKQVDIISSLHYPSFSERERSLKAPHPRTYDWLFDTDKETTKMPGSSNVFNWLHKGKDVFWISGKAGSGKSTLMKYLYNHARTRTALSKWADEKELIIAGFFFWSAGTSIQKSQQGLLQSLLMHILKQSPGLTPSICPQRWNVSRKADEEEPLWSRSELKDALMKLKTQISIPFRLCIFIDGLDEYDGDLSDILPLIRDLASSESIKVCVASRPWTIIEKFWGQNEGKRIVLQDLNRSDIWQFTHEQLSEEIPSRLEIVTETDYSNLVQEIVERSSGVFLWVFLVVRSLIRGMTNYDTIEELWARLLELPTELEEFFKRILDRGDKVYRRQTARLYNIQLNAMDSTLTALDVAHFAQENPYYALNNLFCSRHAEMVGKLEEITRQRVSARCQDLLEFTDKGVLQFLHRTVKDFLETRGVSDELMERAGLDFNAHIFICTSMLVQIKATLQQQESRTLEQNIAQGWYPMKHIVTCFWHHTGKLAQQRQLSPNLLAAFDNAASLLHANARFGSVHSLLWNETSKEVASSFTAQTQVFSIMIF